MGRTLAAIVQPATRQYNNTQIACLLARPAATFGQTSASAGVTRPQPGAYKVNLSRPTRSAYPVSDDGRRAWVRNQFASAGSGGVKNSAEACAGFGTRRLPPKGGAYRSVCGSCGNTALTSVPSEDCCDKCGKVWGYGNGGGETIQIFKDAVKGNRTAFACGGTNKQLGVYGTGSVVTRVFTGTPLPTAIPGIEEPTGTSQPVGQPAYIVQPAPAVKTITVPARKSYAYSTSELIKRTNIGYDANLAIRSCGRRSGTTGDCACNCSLCCQANVILDDRSKWNEPDGICPGGLNGGTSCRTGDGTACGVSSGPCACQSWTYKRKNNEYAANGAVDASQLTARMGRVTTVADECNTAECVALERAQTPCATDPNKCPCSELLPGTRGAVRRIPQELYQRDRRGLRQI